MTDHVVDPDEIGQLYQRCVRCLYMKYRNGKDVGRVAGGEWGASIVGYHAEEAWINPLRGPNFRFRSYGEMIESRAVKYAEAGITLSFAGRYDALLEYEDGSIVLAKCLPAANENSARVHQWGLGGHAFALQHPRTTRVEPIEVAQLALLEFKLTPTGGGKNTVVPRRLTPFTRDDARFSNWMRIVARLLASRVAPREACPVCKDL